MKMTSEILTRLLKGEHLNVDERKRLGLWPCETLRYDEVKSHLANVLETTEWFPRALVVSINGEATQEGIYIHREEQQRFICIAQRTSASNPTLLAERTVLVFESSLTAAEYYLKWELNLPGQLDGWPVRRISDGED